MRLDVRLPLGLMFLCIGSILTVYGALADAATTARTAGVNANLWCGLALLVFAGICLALVVRVRRKNR